MNKKISWNVSRIYEEYVWINLVNKFSGSKFVWLLKNEYFGSMFL